MQIQELRSFCALAEQGSFTRAAKVLGVDKSKVSRDVSALEDTLGTLLVVRTTRSVRLTPEGQTLFERSAQAFGTLAEALAFTGERRLVPAGEITLATTPELARVVLAPLLVRFRAYHPLIHLRLLLDSALVDLTREQADLALRVGRAGAESHVARKITELRSGFFATAAYLARRGVPTQLEHLTRHEGLWPTPARAQKSFAFGGRVPRPAVECGDFELLLQLTLAGGGISLLPEFLAERHVSSGALVRVLSTITLGNGPLFLVSQAPRKLPARVALLRDFLLAELPRALPASG
jgi:DNA-binding transcriptional LysR family regulator